MEFWPDIMRCRNVIIDQIAVRSIPFSKDINIVIRCMFEYINPVMEYAYIHIYKYIYIIYTHMYIYIYNYERGRYYCLFISDHNPQKWGLYQCNVLFHSCKVYYSGLQFIFCYKKWYKDTILYCIHCQPLEYWST